MLNNILQNSPQKAIIALGSNGIFKDLSSAEIVRHAIVALASIGTVTACSRFYSTQAFPVGAGPDFVNAAVVLETDLDAPAVLERLHRIEHDFGRTRTTRWGQRTLDLDLIALGDAVLPDSNTFQHWMHLLLEDQMQDAPDGIILPHPRMQDRAFVLVPVVDIAPDWVHPVLHKSVTQLRDALTPAALAEVVLL